MKDIDNLLYGSIDMHLHVGPDTMPHCVDAIEAARQAQQAGMRAIVLKNHHYTTVPLAITASQLVPGVAVFGGVCLDFEVGGLNFHALEISGKLGAKVVWMPTLSSANSRDKMRQTLGIELEGEGFSILDTKGKLVPEIGKILSLVKKYDMVLASGHISPEETFALIGEAKNTGIWRLVITHASSADVLDRALTLEEQKRLARMGVFLEYVGLELVHESLGHGQSHMAEMIKAVGAEHCIMSTDMGLAFEPPPVEGMKTAISSLLDRGFTQAEIELMVKANPAKLLGLD
jgi:hypothetical protein